jgi:uncharacterized membrane protein YgaE (UPF0421/DUF939 family)
MDNTPFWIIALAVAIISAFISAKLAGKKGHNPTGYAILGFFLPMIGIIVAALLAEKE